METNSQHFFNSVFLAGLKKDSPRDYQPYFHVRSYLRQKYQQSGRTVPELAETMGYRKLDKFKCHLEAWLNANRPVPEKFLEAIGIDPEMLNKVLELDFDQWEEAAAKAALPKSFSARLMPAVCLSVPFPENLNEAQAEDYVKEYARINNRQCLISFFGLRLTWVYPNGSCCRRGACPSIEHRDGFIHFTTEAVRPGIIRLAGKGS